MKTFTAGVFPHLWKGGNTNIAGVFPVIEDDKQYSLV
jgi:hypothetical protein